MSKDDSFAQERLSTDAGKSDSTTSREHDVSGPISSLEQKSGTSTTEK